MKKPRVLIDVNSIISYIRDGALSGIGRTTFELLRQWDSFIDEIPFEIVLYSQNTKGISPKGIFKFKSIHFFWPDRFKWKKFLYPLRLRRLLTKYDLNHIPHNVDITEDESRTILTIHDVMAYRFSELWNSSKWALTDNDRHMLEYGANQCKAIVTCSECSRRDIIHYLNVPESKVVSIPWGVNREMFQPTNDDEYLKNIGIEGLYYFTSSANHPRKNLPLLLESYREYLKLGGRGQLVVLNPEEEHLHGIIDLIEEGRIVILRKISDKELAALYTNAKCSLVLSSYEGFGLPVLESLACGTQVLCARNSSLVEAGGGVVDYIDKMNSTIIAHKILNYDTKEKTDILDEVLLEEHLQKFTWEKCARKYIEFYKTQLGI